MKFASILLQVSISVQAGLRAQKLVLNVGYGYLSLNKIRFCSVVVVFILLLLLFWLVCLFVSSVIHCEQRVDMC